MKEKLSESNNHSKSNKSIAIEEWKLLNSVIARLEDVEYKIRSWLLALITGLAVALYSNKIDLPVLGFAIISILLIVIFAWMDLIHRIPKRYAIERAEKVEEILKDENAIYDGPLMSKSLSEPRKEIIGKELRRMFANTPYIQILILVILLSIGDLILKTYFP